MCRLLVFVFALLLSFSTQPPLWAQLSADKLRQAVGSHIEETTYGASGSVTQCSKFVRDVVKTYVGPDPALNGQVKDQVTALAASTKWEELDYASDKEGAFEKARTLANQGRVVVVAHVVSTGATGTNTGHIALVVPHDALEPSTAWAIKVPIIAQAGKKNPRGMASEASKSVFSELKLSWGFSAATKDELRIFTGKP